MVKTKSIYTVSKINEYVKNMFAGEYFLSAIFVKGEVSNCKYHSSGHIYFTLKDKTSQISCVMFSGQRGGLSFRMEDGNQVIVGGSISVYERDGKYQLYAKQIESAGEGYLYEKYEKLKRDLLKEGLFDEERKKTIPAYGQVVGVVTSETGAVIRDILQVSKQRNPYVRIILYPAKVQGNGAAETIAKGIRVLDKQGVDVIIIGRGGGSIEDLWAFNEELVARAVSQCETPVISAVGHETDTTISDYAADKRAPTPSAAAALAVFDYMSFMVSLADKKDRLSEALALRLEREREYLKRIKERILFMSPENQMLQKRQFLLNAEERLWIHMESRVKEVKNRINILGEKLNGLSPLTRMSAGFAYVSDESGNMIDSIEKVKSGDNVNISFSDGSFTAAVKDCERKSQRQKSEIQAVKTEN